MPRANSLSAVLLTISLTLAAGAAFKPNPFWVARPFSDWTLEECQQLLRESPWSRSASIHLLPYSLETKLRATFHSAEPILLARAMLRQYLPNEFPDRFSTGERLLYAGAIDAAKARRYVDKISYPEDRIVVQVIGGIGSWSRLDALKPKDLTEWTFLRIQMPHRKIELKAKSYVRPSQSPTYEALFLFERPQGVKPPGHMEFVTELPTRPDWKKNRRFHIRLKVKFKLEEMIFKDRVAF